MSNKEQSIELANYELSELKTGVTERIRSFYYQYFYTSVSRSLALNNFIVKLWKKDSTKRSGLSFLHHFYMVDENKFSQKMSQYFKELSDIRSKIQVNEGILVDRIKLTDSYDRNTMNIWYSTSIWQKYFVGLSGFDEAFEINLTNKRGCYDLDDYVEKYFANRIKKSGLEIDSKLYSQIIKDCYGYFLSKRVSVEDNKIKLVPIRKYTENDFDNDDMDSYFDPYDDDQRISEIDKLDYLYGE